MARNFQSTVFLIGCLVAAMATFDVAKADTYSVGDSMGWVIPPLGKIAYETWAFNKDLELGDTVVFNFNGTHDVTEVSETDFDGCIKTNPIGAVQTTSPYSVTLSNGTRYFICTISDHCERGQKVALSLGAASSLAIGAFSFFSSALALALLTHLY